MPYTFVYLYMYNKISLLINLILLQVSYKLYMLAPSSNIIYSKNLRDYK